jgi:DNA end-binding protein Ku
MRSVWNGTLAFGPLGIPVKAYSATEEHGPGLHQLHLNDGGRIRLKRTCDVDGEEVPFEEIGKGYETPGGDVVVLTEEDLDALPVPTAQTIEVHAFAPPGQIDPICFARSYYLEPEAVGIKPYAVLAEALRQSGRVAVVTIALRQRETLAVLRVRGAVLVLTTMLWPDEIRTPEFRFLDESVSVDLRELREATALVERMADDFEPTRYTDRYRAALSALIDRKAREGDVRRPIEPAKEAAVADLMTALNDGVEATRVAAIERARAAVRSAAAAKAAATRAANRAAAKARTRDSSARS